MRSVLHLGWHYTPAFEATYDQDGNLVKGVGETDLGADGTIDGRTTYSFEYDGSPRRP